MQSTEAAESHKEIRPSYFCIMCNEGVPRCPTCLLQPSDRIMLDFDQQCDLYDAVYRQKEGAYKQRLQFSKQRLSEVMEEFRSLLHSKCSWYDKSSLPLIQACYKNLCMRGGVCKKVALAIHFFEGEFARAYEMITLP
jgi:ferredoxin